VARIEAQLLETRRRAADVMAQQAAMASGECKTQRRAESQLSIALPCCVYCPSFTYPSTH
jgi:hypothetical protein